MGFRARGTNHASSRPAKWSRAGRRATVRNGLPWVSAMAVQEPRADADVNAVVGGYLRDLAFAQSSQQQMFGYKRAAAAILSLDRPLTDLLGADGALPRIPGIGPGSTRVIREILETGASPTVERAIERSERRAEIQRRREPSETLSEPGGGTANSPTGEVSGHRPE